MSRLAGDQEGFARPVSSFSVQPLSALNCVLFSEGMAKVKMMPKSVQADGTDREAHCDWRTAVALSREPLRLVDR
jgi:hypothetical protein